MSIGAASGIAATLARIREITGAVAPPPPPTPAPPPGGFAAALGSARAATVPSRAGGAVTGAELDAWMARKNPGAPLVGLGEVLVREGLANGIDPRALAAIARAESALGSDPGARARNNAFGWGPHMAFASLADNIATVARGLRRGYLDEGLVTLAQIQRKYAPVGAANDPAGLNSNWLRNTAALYAELGGDPAGSIALR